MKHHSILLFALLGGLSPLHAASISLASTMNGSSFIAEDFITGGFSRINAGDGRTGTAGYIENPSNPNYANSGDRDGHYIWNGSANPANIPTRTTTGTADGDSAGSGYDVFPRETNFQVGSITYDETLVSTTGVSVIPILSIDLGQFWTSDPNRTASGPGSVPTVQSDISDHALGMWFFNGAGGISFGGLNILDTVTFTDGILTSIDLSIPTTFTASFGPSMSWTGTFSITGSTISYQIDDTRVTPLGPSSHLVANLTGTVNAVVPEPSTALLGSLGLLALARRRR